MTLNAAKEWCLKSGSWVISEEAPGLELKNSALGAAVSPLLSREDVASLVQARRSAAHPALLFPPEFSYSPITGEKLRDAAAVAAAPVWIPPCGIRPLTDSENTGPYGLRRTSQALALSEREHRTEDAEGDVRMNLPPPGSYEFFSGRFATPAATLLALDARKGQVCGWLPVSQKWLPLAGRDKQLLAECILPRSAWRAEMATGAGGEHCIYLPTQHGMALLVADMVSLTYQVDYVGEAAAVGAPIWFDDKVWTPLQDASGTVQFVNADAQKQPGAVLSLPGMPPLAVVGSPLVVSGRMAVWPCEQGQLQLARQPNGAVVTVRFVPWDEGVVPKLEFGSPYCSNDGDLWQLCLDTKRDAYVYVKLGSGEVVSDVDAPRLCSGYFNYFFARKLRTEPWRVEEAAASDTEIVIPLLESSASSAVVGFRFRDNRGLEVVMNDRERVHGQLVMDAKTDTRLYTVAVAEPWHFRLFVHAGVLWAYHPALSRIVGWKLSA